MRNISHWSSVAIVAVLGVLFALTAAAIPQVVIASSESQTFEYLIATGPLCDLEEDACPDIASAPNGDTVELAGSGTFSVHAKSVTGGGSFTHKDADGNVLAQGTWEAVQLLSFQSYGSAVPQGLPENFFGGKVLIRVQGFVDGNPVFMGILRITCTLGDKIPPSAHEGVRLVVPGVINFNKEVSGLTLFILT